MTKGIDKRRRKQLCEQSAPLCPKAKLEKSDLMALKAWEHKMKIKKAPDDFSAGHWKQELDSYSETARKYRKKSGGD